MGQQLRIAYDHRLATRGDFGFGHSFEDDLGTDARRITHRDPDSRSSRLCCFLLESFHR
jgi:hypothetical protein